MEHQYRKGLYVLETQLSEFNADVVLQGRNVLFKPPIEELRDKYYKEIKSFIGWPA